MQTSAFPPPLPLSFVPRAISEVFDALAVPALRTAAMSFHLLLLSPRRLLFSPLHPPFSHSLCLLLVRRPGEVRYPILLCQEGNNHPSWGGGDIGYDSHMYTHTHIQSFSLSTSLPLRLSFYVSLPCTLHFAPYAARNFSYLKIQDRKSVV